MATHTDPKKKKTKKKINNICEDCMDKCISIQKTSHIATDSDCGGTLFGKQAARALGHRLRRDN